MIDAEEQYQLTIKSLTDDLATNIAELKEIPAHINYDDYALEFWGQVQIQTFMNEHAVNKAQRMADIAELYDLINVCSSRRARGRRRSRVTKNKNKKSRRRRI